MDPVGDLLLELYEPDVEGDVGQSSEPQCTFRVSSKVMGLASPVLHALFAPAILQNLNDSPPVENAPYHSRRLLRLYGDNEAALLILLHAAHLRPSLIPNNVSIDLFHQIAVVCHKYDMAKILLMWPRIWTHGLPRTTDVGNWLEIAWVFQMVKLLNQITRRLILHLKIDGDQWVLLGSSYTGEIVPNHMLGECVLLLPASRLWILTGPARRDYTPQTAASDPGRVCFLHGSPRRIHERRVDRPKYLPR